MSESHWTIRRGTKEDASELARLLTLLGHGTTTEEVVARWAAFDAVGNVVLVAADDDGSLAGMATLSRMVVLHRPRPVGRISTMVVDPEMRNRGMGRALVATAEALLASAGCGLLEITSNERRFAAHGFYEHLGYERTSVRLVKALAPPDEATGLFDKEFSDVTVWSGAAVVDVPVLRQHNRGEG